MQKQQAFTLIEILIVVLLAAVLFSFAFPWTRQMQVEREAAWLRSQVFLALQMAQTIANTLGTPVAICYGHLTHCTHKRGDGLLVFINRAGDGKLRSGQEVLQSITYHPRFKASLNFRAFPKFRSFILFDPFSLQNRTNGTFWYCPSEGAKPSWAIVFNQVGRLRVIKPNQSGDIKLPHEHLNCGL